jgi:flagellar basal body rod protein FlgG
MAQQKMDGISHNLANVNTAGYKASRTAFSTIFTNQSSPAGTPQQTPAAYLSMGKQYIDVEEGIMKNTGSEFDFAIRGNGYFRIQKEDGSEAYTRAGNFRLDQNGALLTEGGLPVLDNSGSPIVLEQGTISSTKDGALYVNGNSAAQLGIVTIKDQTQIQKGPFTTIETAAENTEPAGSNVSVHQGMIEGSNVNSVLAMTELMSALRSYQSMMKVVEQYNQLAGQVSERVGTIQG